MCELCGCNETRELYSHFVNNVNYTYGICLHCSYVYQLKKYPRAHYETLPCQGQNDYDEHTKRRAQYIVDFIDNKFHSKIDAKVLDIGCGEGGVMKHLSSILFRPTVYGYTLDTGKKCIDPSLNIIYRNVETGFGDFDGNLYDIIIMSHVVEHLYNPVKTLGKIKELLKSNGVLYIEVPSFINGEVRVPNIFCPEHISFFTVDTIKYLLEMNGYKVLKITDSKYWGNIKVLATPVKHPIKNLTVVNSKSTLLRRSWSKMLFPLYRTIKKFIKIGAND